MGFNSAFKGFTYGIFVKFLVVCTWFTTVAAGREHNLTGRCLDTPALSQEYHGFFHSLVKRPEHEADHSLPFSADVTSPTEFSFG